MSTDTSRSHLEQQIMANLERPLKCAKCSCDFLAFKIRQVEEQELLLDIDGHVVYQLKIVCRRCRTVRYWTMGEQDMQRHTEALEKLLVTQAKMWANQEKEAKA